MTGEKEPGAGGAAGSHSRLVTWVLLGTGAAVLFLGLCQRQKTLEKLPERDVMLQHCGRTLVLSSRADLLESKATDVVLVPSGDEPTLVSLAQGTDAQAFASGLASKGFGCVMADPADDARGGSAPLSVKARLAAYSGGDRFLALMLAPGFALYEPGTPPDPSDALLAFLVGAVRRALSGEDREAIRAGAPADALAPRPFPGAAVAVQIQGLAPREVRSARANRIRHDLFAPGRGTSLLDATLEAADDVARRFGQLHEKSEGPLAGAMDRLRVELHVMYEMALIDHVRPEGAEAAYAGFIDRVLDPGVTGLALNWVPVDPDRPPILSGYRVRPGADAMYWSRADGGRILERLATDASLGKVEDVIVNRWITLDRFRSVHVIESEPGGLVTRLFRGRPLPPDPPADPVSTVARVAGRLARDVAPDGTMAQSYYPERDASWLTPDSPSSPHYEAAQQAYATLALLEAARVTRGADLASAADRALARLLQDVRFCGHDADVVLAVPGPDGLPAPVDGEARMPECQPLDARGQPVAATSFGQGGVDPRPLPRTMAFVVDGNAGSLAVTSLALTALASRPGHIDAAADAALAPLVAGLIEFVLAMQRQDGTFHSHLVAPSHPQDAVVDPRAGALALWALARARSRVEDPRIDAALSRGLAAMIAQIREVADGVGASSTRCRRLVSVAPFVTLAAVEAAGSPGAGAGDALSVPLLMTRTCLLTPEDVIDPDLAGGYVDGVWPMPGADDLMVAAAAAAALQAAGPDASGAGDLALAVALGRDLGEALLVRPGAGDQYCVVPARAHWGLGQDLMNHRQRPWAAFALVQLLSRIH